jgi:hypothetical protein
MNMASMTCEASGCTAAGTNTTGAAGNADLCGTHRHLADVDREYWPAYDQPCVACGGPTIDYKGERVCVVQANEFSRVKGGGLRYRSMAHLPPSDATWAYAKTIADRLMLESN